MAVMARETWTDERLDDLKGQMNERFDRVDKEMNERFDRVEGDIKELRGDVKQIHTDMQAMQRAMVHGTIAICGIMTTGFMTLIGIAAL